GFRGPRNARAVKHREAVFQTQFRRLDPEDEARHRSVVSDLLRHDLVHGFAATNVVLVGADPSAGEKIGHPAQVRAAMRHSGLVVKPAQKNDVLAERLNGFEGLAEFHLRAAAFGPPMNRLYTV